MTKERAAEVQLNNKKMKWELSTSQPSSQLSNTMDNYRFPLDGTANQSVRSLQISIIFVGEKQPTLPACCTTNFKSLIFDNLH